jgi:hypothetical protein
MKAILATVGYGNGRSHPERGSALRQRRSLSGQRDEVRHRPLLQNLQAFPTSAARSTVRLFGASDHVVQGEITWATRRALDRRADHRSLQPELGRVRAGADEAIPLLDELRHSRFMVACAEPESSRRAERERRHHEAGET